MARWTDEFRASAVIMLQAEGYPDTPGAVTRVSNHLRVPRTTLTRWFHGQSNPPPPEIVQVKKEEIISLLKREIHRGLHELPQAIQDADYKEIATTLGILIDKMQLLDGEATARTEVVYELSDTERANRLAALLDAARTRRDGQTPPGEFVQ